MPQVGPGYCSGGVSGGGSLGMTFSHAPPVQSMSVCDCVEVECRGFLGCAALVCGLSVVGQNILDSQSSMSHLFCGESG